MRAFAQPPTPGQADRRVQPVSGATTRPSSSSERCSGATSASATSRTVSVRQRETRTSSASPASAATVSRSSRPSGAMAVTAKRPSSSRRGPGASVDPVFTVAPSVRPIRSATASAPPGACAIRHALPLPRTARKARAASSARSADAPAPDVSRPASASANPPATGTKATSVPGSSAKALPSSTANRNRRGSAASAGSAHSPRSSADQRRVGLRPRQRAAEQVADAVVRRRRQQPRAAHPRHQLRPGIGGQPAQLQVRPRGQLDEPAAQARGVGNGAQLTRPSPARPARGSAPGPRPRPGAGRARPGSGRPPAQSLPGGGDLLRRR